MMMSGRVWQITLLVLGCAAIAPLGYGDLLNGDFSSNLDGWSTIGDVSVVSEVAALGDDGQWYSALYQFVASTPGLYEIEFDFYGGLSEEVPDFTFPDTFFASLYFIDDPGGFDLPGGIYGDAVGLMDMDYSGAYSDEGIITPSGIGPGWQHFSMSFDIIPAFELADFNFINNDSYCLVDNVAITPIIPEPATLSILGGGLLGLLARRRRRG
jgi:hypothetical protein